MNEADRTVSQRLRAATQEEGNRTAAAEAVARRRRAEAWQAILAARQSALASLERAGWPDGTMLSLQRKTMFGYKRHSKAGWLVASDRYRWKDTHVDSSVYLLSDGRLCQQSFGPVIVLEGREAEHIVEGTSGFPFEAVKQGLERLAARR